MKKERPFFKIGPEWFDNKGLEKKNNHMASEYSYSVVEVDGCEFPVFKKEIISANILEAVVGTNGYKGGDSGHGSRTFIRIKDLGSTDIRITKVEPYGDGVEIILGGDTELMTIIDALRFITDVLESKAGDFIDE